ncbi:MAG: hypothetical protein Q8O17_03630 [Candidatus Methanoperedens sp.]|nr:hypothetical protein [Candidatus Methanoperedens sp.]
MNIKNFSIWRKWEERDSLENIEYPGVYAIAISDIDLSGKNFQLIEKIKYFGMTNAHSGLKGRLQQFDNTIKGKIGHGGANRFRYKYPDYKKLIKKLYVSVYPQICDTKSFSPDDLVKMGDVASFEYQCFAEYVKIYNGLPEFNDKKRSPKK